MTINSFSSAEYLSKKTHFSHNVVSVKPTHCKAWSQIPILCFGGRRMSQWKNMFPLLPVNPALESACCRGAICSVSAVGAQCSRVWENLLLLEPEHGGSKDVSPSAPCAERLLKGRNGPVRWRITSRTENVPGRWRTAGLRSIFGVRLGSLYFVLPLLPAPLMSWCLVLFVLFWSDL